MAVTEVVITTSYRPHLLFPDIVRTKTISVNQEAPFDILFDSSDDPFSGAFAPSSTLRVKYGIPETPIEYIATDNSQLLPSENGISLRLTEDYGSSQYQWQCNWGEGWRNLSYPLSSRSEITVSGASLFASFGRDYNNFLFMNIHFRVVYTCDRDRRESETITLRHVPSSPGIVDVDQVLESCYGYNDGQLQITFNRPLYSQETLYIYVNGIDEESPLNRLDENNTATIESLGPGNYSITLQSLYNGDPGYSSGINHSRATEIQARPAITGFQAVVENVHCHSGQDGRITVSAQGGTGNYDAYLMHETDTLATVSLSSASNNSFLNLLPGQYTVRLKDSNGCDPRVLSTNEIIVHNPIVSEPARPLSLSIDDAAEPLGFGLTDGYITARAFDGTPAHSFYWSREGQTFSAEPPVAQGQSTLSTLNNIGTGYYHIRVEDANYRLASPHNEINTRGCFDTVTYFLDQPPLLEVALAESHFVSCYGYSDGEMIAHATGGRPYGQSQRELPYQYDWFSVDNNTPISFEEADSIAENRPSALYRVRVTDRNGITAWSPDFMLVQPDPLLVSFNTSQLLCNGDTDGRSQAFPTGGTPPYQYEWSNDATTPLIENLSEGPYSLILTDERGCTTFGRTEVVVPNSLEAEAAMASPTCYGYADGSISLAVSGGRTPYQLLWDNGEQSQFVNNLSQGSYEVRITDANNCFIVREYELEEPPLLPVQLGDNRTLCIGQTLDLNGTISDQAAVYRWLRDGLTFSTDPAVTISEAGTYKLVVTDTKGCTNEDEFSVYQNNIQIAADFYVATRVPRGESVLIANISHPTPESVEWILPDGVEVRNKATEQVQVVFNNYGEYQIGLRSRVGDCEKTVYQVIQVVDKSELTDYITPDEPYIKQFMVTPNPSNGKFTVSVQLREPGDIRLALYNSQGILVTEQTVNGQEEAKVNMETTTGQGMYMLQLITRQAQAVYKVVIE